MVMLSAFATAHAYDFEVDGIRYNITSFSEFTAVASSLSEAVEGEVCIPSTVEFNGKTLSVIAIGDEFISTNKRITSVKIGNGVKEIGLSAFSGCSNILTVEIPKSIINIKSNAFANCIEVKDVVASGVESIGANSFEGCVSLEKVSFPQLLNISSAAFSGCSKLSYVDCTSVQCIGSTAFAGCAFSSFTVPQSVNKIESKAFSNCQNLESFVIPDNVNTIGSGLFEGCGSLKEVSIGSGVKSLPWIFEDCNNLEKLRLEDSHSTLTFEYCGSREFRDGIGNDRINYVSRDYTPVSSMFSNTNLKEVYIGRNITTEAFAYKSASMESYDGRYYYYVPNPPFSNSNITKLEIGPFVTDFKMCQSKTTNGLFDDKTFIHGKWDGAFQNCTNLAETDIRATASVISDNSFAGCTSLQRITIPNRAKSLGTGVFQNCTALTAVDLGGYIESIGYDTFTGDDNLSLINLRSPVPPTYTTGFSSSEYINTMVNVPVGSIDYYKNSEPWKNFWNLNERYDLISLFEIDEIRYLVTYNNDVQIVGESLSVPKKLSIPSSVSYLGIEFQVVSIADNAFKNCMMIEGLEIGEGITNIGNNAFEGCNNLKEALLPKSLNSLGSGAFKNCSNLEICNLAKPIDNIPSECFYRCTSLKDFSFEGVVTIENYSFYCCQGLTSVVIAPSVMSIGDGAFFSCSNLKEVRFEFSTNPISLGCDGGRYTQTSFTPFPNPTTVDEKRTAFRNIYYDGLFYRLPIRRLIINRNIEVPKYYERRRGASSGSYSIVYDDIVYFPPFHDLEDLTYLEIGENVTAICRNQIEAVVNAIPTTLEYTNFEKCRNIYIIVSNNPNAPIGGSFSQSAYKNAHLFLSNGGEESYRNDDYWKQFSQITEAPFIKIESITFDADEVVMDLHESKTLAPSLNPVNASLQKLSWYSSDSSIVEVSSDGTITSSYREGEAIIKVYARDLSGVSATVKIVVKKGSNITDTLTDEAFDVHTENGKILINGKAESEIVEVFNVQGQLVTYSTSNVIEIDSKGVYVVKIGKTCRKVII